MHATFCRVIGGLEVVNQKASNVLEKLNQQNDNDNYDGEDDWNKKNESIKEQLSYIHTLLE